MTVYLLNYNNYYNKRIKDPGAALGNLLAAADYYEQYDNINFHIKDGVSTSLVITRQDESRPVDYLIVFHGADKITRWYIMEDERIAANQYRLTLFRDCLADYFEDIKTAPMFIERAYLNSQLDMLGKSYLVFNQEDISVNQIKTAEYPLKDASQTPWVVGYITQNAPAKEIEGGEERTHVSVTGHSLLEGVSADISVASKENWQYFGLVGQKLIDPYRFDTKISLKIPYYYGDPRQMVCGDYYLSEHRQSKGSFSVKLENAGLSVPSISQTGLYFNKANDVAYEYSDIQELTVNVYNKLKTDAAAIGNYALELAAGSSGVSRILDYKAGHAQVSYSYLYENFNGKVLYDQSANTYYKITIKRSKEINSDLTTINTWSAQSNFNSYLYDLIAPLTLNQKLTKNPAGKAAPEWINTSIRTAYEVELLLTPMTEDGTIEFPVWDNRLHTFSQPYDIFCMPLEPVQFRQTSGGQTYTSVGGLAYGMAAALSTELGTQDAAGGIVDLQILPYCPILNLLQNGVFELHRAYSKQIHYIKKGGVPLSFLAFVPEEDININISQDTLGVNADIFPPFLLNPLDRKIDYVARKYRLKAGNYASAFDISPQMNGGISAYHIRCTYKPVTPFIQVQPHFSDFYGADFGDERGLIMKGDFSLPLNKDQWLTYKRQNLTYQEAFNRQVETQELLNKKQEDLDWWSAAAGVVGGTVQGAGAGGFAGGLWGALAGGVAGGAASLAGGIADFTINKEIRAKQLNLQKDLFSLSHKNIEALPNLVTRVSSFDIISKIFPFLEIYTCTEGEIQELETYFNYYGMNISSVGSLSDYYDYGTQHYIQARPIRIEGIGDTQIVNTIAEELAKGVYI